MVKANAYGHGILKISESLLDYGADYLGVAYLEEELYLRKNGVRAPIVVLGAINTDQIEDFINYDIDITSSSIDKSIAISQTAAKLGKPAAVHMKFDTGMERIGVHWYNAEKFIDTTLSLSNINIRGAFSHFAKSDSDKDFTEIQIDRFNTILDFFTKRKSLPELIHFANSAAILNHPNSHYNTVRPGIMLYGYHPAGYPNYSIKGSELKPVMSLKTKVSYFKVCSQDTGISYNHTYKTKEQTRIITLPIGYGDGYPRSLSNKGEIIVRDKKYTISGTVCMDQMMCDIGPTGSAYNGDDVLLFGNEGKNSIPLDMLCNNINTVTYEFLCGIADRVPRVYLDE
jgi:alanine racemase